MLGLLQETFFFDFTAWLMIYICVCVCVHVCALSLTSHKFTHSSGQQSTEAAVIYYLLIEQPSRTW